MNFVNNIPIYIQLVETIKLEIISGKLLPGEKLFSVREYATKLKVNPNTMQKALVELENINLIYTERTNGKYVTNDIKLIEKYKNKCAKDILNNYFTSMNSIGISKNDAINYIKGDKE